jgi:hypothetical protein
MMHASKSLRRHWWIACFCLLLLLNTQGKKTCGGFLWHTGGGSGASSVSYCAPGTLKAGPAPIRHPKRANAAADDDDDADAADEDDDGHDDHGTDENDDDDADVTRMERAAVGGTPEPPRQRTVGYQRVGYRANPTLVA